MEKDKLCVLVTAGGTIEKIDDVRSITNSSTGRLGSLIADEFARKGASVTYICGEGALRPSLSMQGIYAIDSVAQLSEMLEKQLGGQKFDCVVHSMAVSDYTLQSVTTIDTLSDIIAGEMKRKAIIPSGDEIKRLMKAAIMQSNIRQTGKKLSSNLDDMLLMMRKAPKVIQTIKVIQPETILVGFKLLAGVEKQELIRVATALLERSRCDYVLANDLEEIHGDKHKAMLIGADKSMKQLETKQEIAQAIVAAVLEKKGRGMV